MFFSIINPYNSFNSLIISELIVHCISAVQFVKIELLFKFDICLFL